jgi:hypothetical protein
MVRDASKLSNKYFYKIIDKLKEGEKSTKIKKFDRDKNLKLLNANFLKKSIL